MLTRKHLLIAILVTCLLTIFLITVIPIRSQTSGQYDPWLDTNDDGKIDIRDIALVAKAFGTAGDPINKTELLIDLNSTYTELLNTINSYNASLVDLQARVVALELERADASLPSTSANSYPWPEWSALDTILYSIDLDQSTVGNQQSIFVQGNTTITVTGQFQIFSTSNGAGDIRQAFFLFSWTPSWPVPNSNYYQALYDGVPGVFRGVTQTFSFNLTVPSQPGVYHLYFCAAHQYDMQGAVDTYTQTPSLSHATIIVMGT